MRGRHYPQVSEWRSASAGYQTHSHTHSHTLGLTHTHTHTRTVSLIHQPTEHIHTHSHTHSLTTNELTNKPLTYPLTHALTHSFTHSLTHSCPHRCLLNLPHTFIFREGYPVKALCTNELGHVARLSLDTASLMHREVSDRGLQGESNTMLRVCRRQLLDFSAINDYMHAQGSPDDPLICNVSDDVV